MIGGKILDGSALAALVGGHLGALAWVATARQVGLVLYVPSLALSEVRAVLPDSGPQLAELLGHPSIVLGELAADDAEAVAALLGRAQVWDGLAGHVVHIARRRRWPVLSADPDRLFRVDRHVEVDEL